MPALSPTMEKGNLAKWLKKEGDKVKSGDVLAEIETDKATMEVEAIDEGTLAKILVPEGTADVPVNDVIAVIAVDGEKADAITVPAKTSAPAQAPAAASAPKPAAPTATPVAAAPAPAPATRPPAPPSAEAHQANGAEQRVFATPLARRLAKDGGLDLTRVAGSGPHGRIIERDIKAAIAAGPASTTAPIGLPSSLSDAVIKGYFTPEDYSEVPHDNMRRTIARRLSEANQAIPQFYLTLDCEIDTLLKLREDINKSAPKGQDGAAAFKVYVNDMVIKALAMALV